MNGLFLVLKMIFCLLDPWLLTEILKRVDIYDAFRIGTVLYTSNISNRQMVRENNGM